MLCRTDTPDSCVDGTSVTTPFVGSESSDTIFFCFGTVVSVLLLLPQRVSCQDLYKAHNRTKWVKLGVLLGSTTQTNMR